MSPYEVKDSSLQVQKLLKTSSLNKARSFHWVLTQGKVSIDELLRLID